MKRKKRYALVGAGGRSIMYIDALLNRYKKDNQLVALCDLNMTRMAYMEKTQREKAKTKPIPMYHARDFDKMIKEKKPDCVIVTSMDRTHHKYICRAMELGCDAITEKPMTTDEKKCQQIIDTVKRTKKNLVVTFNYRYAPKNTKIKEIIQKGEIGDVLSVHFEWLLDTRHGADYFRRWHRDKINGGGLLVHKSTHHFDLMNWWLGTRPETVFSMSRLAFYGRHNAEARGMFDFYTRCLGSKTAKKDPFAIDLKREDRLKGLYLNAEHEDGYIRDQSVFGYGISIEDNMGVMVRYKTGAVMTYMLNAHSPWEGYRIGFNGTKGRLEVFLKHRSYVSGAMDDANQPESRAKEKLVEIDVPPLILQHHWKRPVEVPFKQGIGGHGGGDVRLLDDIFLGVKKDPYKRAAGWQDGAMSILTGVAANKSIASGLPVEVDGLVNL